MWASMVLSGSLGVSKINEAITLNAPMMTSYTFADVENEDDELDAILHNGFNK